MRLAGVVLDCVDALALPSGGAIGFTRRSPALPRRSAHRRQGREKGTAAKQAPRQKPRRSAAETRCYATMPLGERVAHPVRPRLERPLQRPDHRRVHRPSGRRGEGVPEGPQVQGDRRAGRAGARRARRAVEEQAGRRSAGAWSTTRPPARRSAFRPSRCRNTSRGSTRHPLVLGAGPGPGRDLPHPRAGRDAGDGVRAAEKEPANRKLEVNLLRNDFFILSGTQGLKKFYVRAEVRDLEIRGITVLWDRPPKASWTRSWW